MQQSGWDRKINRKQGSGQLTTTRKEQLKSTGPRTVLGFCLVTTLLKTPRTSNPVLEYRPGMVLPTGGIAPRVGPLGRRCEPFGNACSTVGWFGRCKGFELSSRVREGEMEVTDSSIGLMSGIKDG